MTAFTSGREITSRLSPEEKSAFTFSPTVRAREGSISEIARNRTAGWVEAMLARCDPMRPAPTTAMPSSLPIIPFCLLCSTIFLTSSSRIAAAVPSGARHQPRLFALFQRLFPGGRRRPERPIDIPAEQQA